MDRISTGLASLSSFLPVPRNLRSHSFIQTAQKVWLAAGALLTLAALVDSLSPYGGCDGFNVHYGHCAWACISEHEGSNLFSSIVQPCLRACESEWCTEL